MYSGTLLAIKHSDNGFGQDPRRLRRVFSSADVLLGKNPAQDEDVFTKKVKRVNFNLKIGINVLQTNTLRPVFI